MTWCRFVDGYTQLTNSVTELRDRLVTLSNFSFKTMGFDTRLAMLLEVPLRNLAFTNSAQEKVGTDGSVEWEWCDRLQAAAIP